MQIKSVAITNYKSFLEKQTLHFESGFNLLLGTNNAGKTSVLDVIDMDFSLNEPHRSERTIPIFGGQPIQLSEFEVALKTKPSELRALAGVNPIYLPTSTTARDFNGRNSTELVLDFLERDALLQLTSQFGHGLEKVVFAGDDLIGGTASRQEGQNPLMAAAIRYDQKQPAPYVDLANYGSIQGAVGNYAQLYKHRIYRFSAKRSPGVSCGLQNTHILDREAVTLPYCINHLQTNDAHGHRQLCGWINRVFPSVQWVQAPPNGSAFELRCLPLLPEARRDDLAIPLARMGAGIGNVIAMFYVLLTSRAPQVIAIDEPNAFLHPRALRELLSILETEGRHHQFILTAHSADVLTAVNTRSISMLEFDGVATTVREIDQKNLHAVRSELTELGIRMTDLHAKDQVLWVEGQTEELVLPDLLRWACPEVAAGTAVLRVERTGTFSKKGIDPAEVAQIYERLSSSSALVPPMICILLDGETRSSKNCKEIEIASQGKLRFLDRRMLENYLFHPQALTSTMAELGLTVSLEKVSSGLSGAIGSIDIAEIDGAKVLATIFSELSAATHEFRKTRDVPTLIAWILENDPAHLEPLRGCLRKTFSL